MGKERDIFISYSSKNMEVAEDIREHLEQNGFTWQMAPYCITGGSDYAELIMDGISACKVFLLVLTEEAQLSPHVRRELECAINSNKVIVPIHMDQSAIQKAYQYHLSVNQIIDANNRKLVAYREMLETIEALGGVKRRTRTGNAEKTNAVGKTKESVTKSSGLNGMFFMHDLGFAT